ncbi:MAG: NTP transferase domain-containing protein [Methanomicrobiales archaeon]|nr:NTP transferase domain-containing protein [Methanomicrobiales archaeon]
MGEKPLVTVHGKPMLSYVVRAFEQARCEVIVVLTFRTPHTLNWCHAQGLSTITTKGIGYIEDLVEAIDEVEEKNPFFTSVSDLPCIRSSTIQYILSLYRNSKKPACSTWIPVQLVKESGISIGYTEHFGKVEVCPTGVNILLGSQIHEEQEECRLVLDVPDLIYHVNTRSDLETVNRLQQKGLS